MSAQMGSRLQLLSRRRLQLGPAPAIRRRGDFAGRVTASGGSAARRSRLLIGATAAALLSAMLIPHLAPSTAGAAQNCPDTLRIGKGPAGPAGERIQDGLEATATSEECGAFAEAVDFSLVEETRWDEAPQTEGPRYRVVGVEADDVLNVRAAAGVSNRIVGTLPPDATGVALSGREQPVGGGTWVEIEDPSLPGGSGWVNARFLAPHQAPAARASAAEPQSASVGALAARFTDAPGYQMREPEALVGALREMLPADPSSVFHPDSDIGPLAKAILLLEANEGVLPRVRYRLRYGMAMVEAPSAADPLTMSFVQVDRFNLGPRIRDEAARSAGAGRVGPAEAFGAGPHVSYRLAMRPVQGQAADVIAAARAEIPGATVEDMDCLGISCLAIQSVGESTVEWGGMEEVAFDFAPAYEEARDGVLSPAAAIDLAARELGAAEVSGERLIWSGLEARESVAPLEAFAEAIIEVNLAQDAGLDAVFREGELMDDSLRAVWQRIAAIPGAPGASPQVFGAKALECRRGAAFAAPGELCP